MKCPRCGRNLNVLRLARAGGSRTPPHKVQNAEGRWVYCTGRLLKQPAGTLKGKP